MEVFSAEEKDSEIEIFGKSC